MPQVFVQGFAEPRPSTAGTVMGGLADVLQVINERRAKNEEELQQKLALLYKYPEFADTLGEDIKRKWGRKKPQVASLVDAMQKQNQLARDSEASQAEWARAVAEEEKRRYDMRAAIGEQPDTINIPTPGFGVLGLPTVMPLPNPAKREAAAAIDNLPDAQYEALMRMDPKKRQLVVAQMMRDGKSIPQGKQKLDLSKMSEKVRTAIALGASPEEALEIARIESGQKLSPAELEKDQIHDANQKAEIDARALAATTAFERSQDLARIYHDYDTQEEDQRQRNREKNGGGEDGGKEVKAEAGDRSTAEALVDKHVLDQKELAKREERLATLDNAIAKATTESGKKAAQDNKVAAIKEYAEADKKKGGLLSPTAANTFRRGFAAIMADWDARNVAGVELGGKTFGREEALNMIMEGYLKKVESGTPESDAMKEVFLAFDYIRSIGKKK